MDIIMYISGLKDVKVTKLEEVEDRVALHVELEMKDYRCPRCQKKTQRVHDYRIQKIKHLKRFERLTYLFYKKRRYAFVACAKKFPEKNSFIERYHRFLKEWNQAVHLRSVKPKHSKKWPVTTTLPFDDRTPICWAGAPGNHGYCETAARHYH